MWWVLPCFFHSPRSHVCFSSNSLKVFKNAISAYSYFRMMKNVFMGEAGVELEVARQMEGFDVTLGLPCINGLGSERR